MRSECPKTAFVGMLGRIWRLQHGRARIVHAHDAASLLASPSALAAFSPWCGAKVRYENHSDKLLRENFTMKRIFRPNATPNMAEGTNTTANSHMLSQTYGRMMFAPACHHIVPQELTFHLFTPRRAADGNGIGPHCVSATLLQRIYTTFFHMLETDFRTQFASCNRFSRKIRTFHHKIGQKHGKPPWNPHKLRKKRHQKSLQCRLYNSWEPTHLLGFSMGEGSKRVGKRSRCFNR